MSPGRARAFLALVLASVTPRSQEPPRCQAELTCPSPAASTDPDGVGAATRALARAWVGGAGIVLEPGTVLVRCAQDASPRVEIVHAPLGSIGAGLGTGLDLGGVVELHAGLTEVATLCLSTTQGGAAWVGLARSGETWSVRHVLLDPSPAAPADPAQDADLVALALRHAAARAAGNANDAILAPGFVRATADRAMDAESGDRDARSANDTPWLAGVLARRARTAAVRLASQTEVEDLVLVHGPAGWRVQLALAQSVPAERGFLVPGLDPAQAVRATCPFSGRGIRPDSLVVFRGRVVGFCNPDCRDKFALDPLAHLHLLPELASGEAVPGHRRE